MRFADIPQLTSPGTWECTYSLERFIKQMRTWIKDENLEVNLDFQRGHVWTERQQEKFMEFLLQDGKSGRTIYLNHVGWNKGQLAEKGDFVCVDGLQRYTAISKFINNEIKVFGHYYNEYSDKHNAGNIKINVNDLQTRKQVLNWYLEINDAGTPHTREELDKVKYMLSCCE